VQPWSVDPALDLPPSRQLVQAVLDAVASGELPAGAQLPSVRGLAAEALVNHNTVARAWRELEHLGVVEGENGRGVFVTPQGPARARELRRASTLAAFERALGEALRAGHELDDLIGRAAARRKESA
jgi:GntR family transcriptional regulator